MKGHPLFKEDNDQIAKIHEIQLKIFSHEPLGHFQPKLVTKPSWIKGIQICSNEGHILFLKIVFSRIPGPISPNLAQNILG